VSPQYRSSLVFNSAERRMRVAPRVACLGRLSKEWAVNTFLDQRVLDRIRAEYLEMPGLKLRMEQVQRLFGIEQTMCKLILDALVNTSFLCLQSDGTYVRLTEGYRGCLETVRSTSQST
jgi:hypothetical protein